jgi:two-component system, OmpR family, sensor kinase
MYRDTIKLDLLIHDLKGPIAVVEAGVSGLLTRREKYGPLTQDQEKVLIRTSRNVKLLQALVNDILELGRSRAGVNTIIASKISELIGQSFVEIFDLVDQGTAERIKACTELSGLKAALKEKGIALFIDEGLWCQEIFLDETKIRQILRNLLYNALKYRKKSVEVAIEKQYDHLMLSVADDGEGIPEIYHKKIFESYFQLDVSDTHAVRGHGLGLAGVMVLVEDMGGRLNLESEEGRGAKFLVTVPLKR